MGNDRGQFKRSVLFLSVFVFCFGILISDGQAFDDGDVQYWNTESISWKVRDEWTMTLEEEFRFGDDASDFYYQHSDVGVVYSGVADWLDLGVNYRGVSQESAGEWHYENRPHVNATLKTTWHKMKLSNRSRMEFRIQKTAEDKPRYRNRTALQVPVTWMGRGWQPYVADEVFLDFDSAELTRNRINTGVKTKLTERVSLDIYYVLEHVKSADAWKKTNAVGTKINVAF